MRAFAAACARLPSVVHAFLCDFAFPVATQTQTLKLSASGHDLLAAGEDGGEDRGGRGRSASGHDLLAAGEDGGEMEIIAPNPLWHSIALSRPLPSLLLSSAPPDSLFGGRLGFTGTPNDLTPDGVAVEYDAPAEAAIFRALTAPATLGVVPLPAWSVLRVLALVAGVPPQAWPPPHGLTAAPPPPLRALIDCGALVTGLGNVEVAAALLALGLPGVDGVVFFGACHAAPLLSVPPSAATSTPAVPAAACCCRRPRRPQARPATAAAGRRHWRDGGRRRCRCCYYWWQRAWG